MGRYNRLSLLVGLVMFPALLFAQFNNNTTSPYSRYGLGELQSTGFGRSSAMGGAAFASRFNKQINLSNPAAYNAIDSLGFMFEFGVDSKFSNFKNDLGNNFSNDVNFQYFAMNFNVSKRIGAAMGLVPFSDVGYNVELFEEVENTGVVRTIYYGAGTLSKAFLGLAVEPFKNVSIGANLNYTFGMLNQNAEVDFFEASDFYRVQQYKSLRISDFGFEFGVQATIPLENDRKVILAAVFENNPKYNAKYSEITQKNLSTGSSVDQDTLSNPSLAVEQDRIIEYPYSFGIGISFVKNNSFEINADYEHKAWGDAIFLGDKSVFLTDLNKFALGAEWIPDRFSIQSYLKRVSYRAGFKFEETYLKFNEKQINDFGISFGLGLPVYRSNSTIDVAVQFGKMGTKKNNLVLENYARLNLSVNLYDLWFIKRRFD